MAASPVPHGFGLAVSERRLLRSRPPAQALSWAVRAVGRDVRLVRVRPLVGGRSSAIHLLLVEDRHGARERLVLRRHVRADWLTEEPDLADKEAVALQLVAASAVVTPLLLAVDPTGHEAGAPAVLMTALPGRLDWAPTDLAGYLRRLAEVLAEIHSTPVPAGCGLPPYAPYEWRKAVAPPPWTRRRRVWERAIEIYQGPIPAGRVLLHRDYHPGNVLWRRGRVTGVVDWVNTSLGVGDADVGHCRANLDIVGPGAADEFLARWLVVTGRDGYDPYWDLVAVVGTADSYSVTSDADLDRWVARAVAALG